MVQWRKRKRGTPNQIGKPFLISGESIQKKRGTLAKIRQGFAGKSHGKQEHEYFEKLTKGFD